MTRYQPARPIGGVIAAIPTPVSATLEPDADRLVALAQRQLASGCDGLNLLGTTGEATSFDRQQRLDLMSVAASALPANRMLVGTGAASVADAVVLTRRAGELGFAGALILPPFYYKDVPIDGLAAYFDQVVAASADTDLPLYLYHFPAMSGVPISEKLLHLLVDTHGPRIRGLKDSSTDRNFSARIAATFPDLDVFPSDESVLLDARYAGCISATASVTAPLCGAARRGSDQTLLELATRIRGICASGPLIPNIKSLVAAVMGDAEYSRTVPPLAALDQAHQTDIVARVRDVSTVLGL